MSEDNHEDFEDDVVFNLQRLLSRVEGGQIDGKGPSAADDTAAAGDGTGTTGGGNGSRCGKGTRGGGNDSGSGEGAGSHAGPTVGGGEGKGEGEGEGEGKDSVGPPALPLAAQTRRAVELMREGSTRMDSLVRSKRWRQERYMSSVCDIHATSCGPSNIGRMAFALCSVGPAPPRPRPRPVGACPQ